MGIFPNNLKKRYPKINFKLENIENLNAQLDPDKILGIDIAPAHWSTITDQRVNGSEEIIQELADQFELNVIGVSIGGNAFICHHTVFQELLIFWEKAYNYLFNKYGFKPNIIYSQITMLFFANCNKQIVPILDRIIKNVVEDDLPYHIYNFDSTVEAKFTNLIQAKKYCEYNRYRYS